MSPVLAPLGTDVVIAVSASLEIVAGHPLNVTLDETEAIDGDDPPPPWFPTPGSLQHRPK
jgi:hypothetical protein